jgi:cobalt/nickel transport system permease protein
MPIGQAKSKHQHHHGHDVGERLYIHRHTPIHSLPPALKIASLILFLFVVVATPITNWLSYIFFFTLIISVIVIAKLPVLTVFRRSLIEIPFILFAVLMPFFGTGESFVFLNFTIYEEGLLAAAAIVAKGTIGVLGAITLSATSTAKDILQGLEKLKLPSLMVNIATFSLRYINVVSDEMDRMKVARQSRGFEARGMRDWKILGSAAAALFIRSYERGERVHLAMLSRGFSGHLPKLATEPISHTDLIMALSLPITALVLSLLDRLVI